MHCAFLFSVFLLNRRERTNINTKSASVTLCVVDYNLAVDDGDCGAAELHAHLAVLALVGTDFAVTCVLYCLEKCAGSLCDDYGGLVSVCFFLDYLLEVLYVKGIR